MTLFCVSISNWYLTNSPILNGLKTIINYFSQVYEWVWWFFLSGLCLVYLRWAQIKWPRLVIFFLKWLKFCVFSKSPIRILGYVTFQYLMPGCLLLLQQLLLLIIITYWASTVCKKLQKDLHIHFLCVFINSTVRCIPSIDSWTSKWRLREVK